MGVPGLALEGAHNGTQVVAVCIFLGGVQGVCMVVVSAGEQLDNRMARVFTIYLGDNRNFPQAGLDHCSYGVEPDFTEEQLNEAGVEL